MTYAQLPAASHARTLTFRSCLVIATILAVSALSACADDASDDPQADASDLSDSSLDVDSSDDSDVSSGPMKCNGHEELCDRKFNEVAFPATHNSMSNAEEEWSIPNQNFGLERQLADGVRGFLLDVYKENDELVLCHTACVLGSRPFNDALHGYVEFLEVNPHEVLIFIIQDGTDTESIAGSFTETGLDKYVYTHTDGETWPTLRTMIEADTRLLVTLEGGDPPPAYMRKFWNIGWDTPYSFESAEDFSCEENRGTKGNDLFLVNHWLSTPLSSPENAQAVNPYDVLSPRVKKCEEEGGQIPNVVAVDFYEIGALFQVVDELNGVRE